MGNIKILAKNIIGKANQTFRQDASNIINISGRRFRQNGETGGVKYGNNIPVLQLRVTKVEGPFDEKGNKVISPKDGTEYIFKATFNRPAEGDEWKRLLWAKKINGVLLVPLPSILYKGEITSNKLQVKAKIPCNHMRLYAYMAAPLDSSSVDVTYKKVVAFFIGGAGDKRPFMGTGPYKNIVFAKNLFEPKLNKELNKENKKSFYISDYLGYYEVYGENNIQTYVLNKIPDKETAVYLIGHSLGGWNAMHLSKILSDKGYNVKMLIALDPVGTGLFIKFSDIYNTSPSPKSNYFIYITCEGGSYSFSDFVADLGGQLKEIDTTNNPKMHSIKYKINADIKHKTEINHLDADGMFDEKIQNGLSALDFMLNDVKNTLNIL